MWNIKHEIISPNFYELIIKIEIKGGTALDLKNFYNHINICLNVVTRLQEDLITDYQSIKIHFDFEKSLVPDRSYHYYSWNAQT